VRVLSEFIFFFSKGKENIYISLNLKTTSFFTNFYNVSNIRSIFYLFYPTDDVYQYIRSYT
jgi:hypothetical protein